MRNSTTVTDVTCDLCQQWESNVVGIEYTSWVRVVIESKPVDLCDDCSRQIADAYKKQQERQTEVPF